MHFPARKVAVPASSGLRFRHRIETETEKKNTMLAWWCSTRVKRPAAECYAETLQKGCPEICPRIALSQGHPLVNDWSDRLRSATM
ncbi:uncharacterized protein LOC120421016 isoform X2 [Culex pipiens pallens]|uniref:uncharacterized protein LOC120421016 isoform X2 n=1 Tax=Culex pipiens pallens TaxID=42434 RepID=UPI001953EA6A|nr:uncharacterized protein LOC120421016 isoform X2 [Culex pipiens pallens]